ncbi:MAG: toll/interleukin-1 receptor domain-containing protein [Cyanobacteria bacterium P01_E01_bin.34]
MSRVFLSYRRSDSPYVVEAIREQLEKRLGSGTVFVDIHDIPFGVDFRQYIQDALTQCSLVLAVIGEDWFGVQDDGSERRLDSSSDYVRIELETALKRDIPVIPVLVGKMILPDEIQLPDSLKDLAYRNAAEVRPGREQSMHMELLVQGVEAHLSKRSNNQQNPRNSSKRSDEYQTVHFFWKGAWGPGNIKVYLDKQLIGEGSFAKGIDLTAASVPGSHRLELKHSWPESTSGPYDFELPKGSYKVALSFEYWKKSFKIESVGPLT